MVELTIEQLMHLLNSAVREGAQGAPEYTHMDVQIAITAITKAKEGNIAEVKVSDIVLLGESL